MFMSADAPVAKPAQPRGLVIGASVACLAAALLVVFPGWVMARF